jgi:hypothetical protein
VDEYPPQGRFADHVGRLEDFERIEALTLEDFATDFSKVPTDMIRMSNPRISWD